MADDVKMNFYKTLYDLASVFPEKGRKALLVAMLDYFFEGVEPESIGAKERKAFEAVRGRIDASKSQGDRRRGKKRNRNDNQTDNRNGNRNDNQTDNRNEERMRTVISPSPSLSFSPYREGVQGEGDGAEPPTADAVRAYFAANCLRGDPDEFLDFYAAQGWRRSNGLPVEDWEAQARNWSRRQVDIDAKAPAPPPRPPAEDYDDPEQLARWERELAAMRGGEA